MLHFQTPGRAREQRMDFRSRLDGYTYGYLTELSGQQAGERSCRGVQRN